MGYGQGRGKRVIWWPSPSLGVLKFNVDGASRSKQGWRESVVCFAIPRVKC